MQEDSASLEAVRPVEKQLQSPRYKMTVTPTRVIPRERMSETLHTNYI
jgi:hypothetical protein